MLAIGSSAAAQDLSAQPSLVHQAVATTTAVANSMGTVTQQQPAQSVTVKLPDSIATEAAWLYKAGWPLYALVDKYSAGAPLDEQANCLATAVYFEARGESLDGQLAVARVVMNRAASRSIQARRLGHGRRASRGWRSPMSCRASSRTCCGTTRPMSRPRGAAG
jgi:hypothetical protein